MRKINLILIVFLVSHASRAQTNLIVNPSFEDFNRCPSSFNSIVDVSAGNYNSFVFPTVAKWIIGTASGTPDYFHVCAKNSATPYFSPPSNLFGNIAPRSGFAYAGFYLYGTGAGNREYIQTRLSSPMIAGHTYSVSYYLNLGTKSDEYFGGQRFFDVSAVDNMGAVFSENHSAPSIPMRTFTNGIINPAGRYITDTLGWTRISGIYTAKGNEEWMVIGAFTRPDSSLPDHVNVWKGVKNADIAYYFIDDVCVFDLDEAVQKTHLINLCAIDTSLMIRSTHTGGEYLWNTGDTAGLLKIAPTEGKYWVQNIGENCSATIDTFILSGSYMQPATINVNLNVLGTSAIYDSYHWLFNDQLISGATNRNYTVTQNGDYRVIVSSNKGCIDTSDSYTVTNITTIKDPLSIARKIKIYPNPSRDIIHISSPISLQAQLSSIEGRIVLQEINVKSISLSTVSSGVYFLSLRNEDGELIKVEKIVKK